jgi:hypothetical protein
VIQKDVDYAAKRVDVLIEGVELLEQKGSEMIAKLNHPFQLPSFLQS